MNDRIARLHQFLADSPDDCFLNHALALEHVKLEQDAEARRLFEKNRSHDAAYVATYYHLGKLLERAGEPDAALLTYEEGMKAARAAGDNHSYNELQAAADDLL